MMYTVYPMRLFIQLVYPGVLLLLGLSHCLAPINFFCFQVAWVMQVCMGTTAGESLNAAGNIFVGQVSNN